MHSILSVYVQGLKPPAAYLFMPGGGEHGVAQNFSLLLKFDPSLSEIRYFAERGTM